METSGQALVDHWDWAIKKGLMNPNTGRSLRSATAQVLGVLDDWETVDIRKLDIEDILNRFVSLRKKDFKPDSLETYKQRFRQAMSMYLAYLEDPGGWKPRARVTTAPDRSREHSSRTSRTTTAPPNMDADVDRPGLISYPFPLREGKIARLFLPADLTVAEVRRLTNYMMTLAVDAQSE